VTFRDTKCDFVSRFGSAPYMSGGSRWVDFGICAMKSAWHCELCCRPNDGYCECVYSNVGTDRHTEQRTASK
jgi:hypothetical protein